MDDRYRFINSINVGGEDLADDPDLERDYNAFFINRALSYHEDTIAFAYQMDRYGAIIPKRFQYLFLLNKIKKAKRFAKLVRKSGQNLSDDLKEIQTYFKVNIHKAQEILPILTAEQLKLIKQKNNQGGYVKKNEQ